ncbi:MAG: hypothetical protein RKP20_09375 [Candidatus Competibacter sp.]|nr:hypothetical protein [Candidatus Competibacter sp.]
MAKVETVIIAIERAQADHDPRIGRSHHRDRSKHITESNLGEGRKARSGSPDQPRTEPAWKIVATLPGPSFRDHGSVSLQVAAISADGGSEWQYNLAGIDTYMSLNYSFAPIRPLQGATISLPKIYSIGLLSVVS